MFKYIKKISIRTELVFLLFIALNLIKLTSLQWLITQSVYTPGYVVLKNALFLYTFWRILFLFRKRITIVLSFIVQFLYLGIHTLYYLYSEQTLLLSQFFYSFFEGLSAITSIYIVLDSPWLLLLIIDIPIFIIISRHYVDLRSRLWKTSMFIIPLMLVLTIAGFLRLGFFDPEKILHDSFSRRNFKYGTIYAQIYDLRTDQQTYIKSIEYGQPITFTGRDKKYNVVSIQVESLNADIIGFSYKGIPIMPFLRQKAEENIYYPYCLAQHKTGNSSDAEFSVFNSVEALDGYPASQFTEYDYPNSFVKQLEGYSRLAFHGNKGDFYNRYFNIEKMGFDKFWDRLLMDLDEEGWGAPDEKVYNFMLEKISGERGNFYYHHITMTSHGPFENAQHYYLHPDYDTWTVKAERDYLNSFSYVDKSLQDFIEKVQKSHPDTFFFIYGDHTVDIAGDFYNSSSRFKDEDYLYEFVPLIIISPERKNYIEKSRVISFLDLAPSILDATGHEAVIRTLGESVLPDEYGNVMLEKQIPFFGKYISRSALFNLASANIK